MLSSKLISTLKTLKTFKITCLSFLVFSSLFIFPNQGFGRIYIDINPTSIQKIKIAIPDFKILSTDIEQLTLSTELAGILSNDLELSGYFTSMDKDAFLDEDGPLLTKENIQFKNWSVIGAELLIKGGYTKIGQSLEVEVRLYDVFWGRQILVKKASGRTDQIRPLMHGIGNEIISA